jgi:hypothetical protein
MMDLAMEQSLLLLIRGLLLAISAISVISTITMVSVISSIDCVDLSILLLLLWVPLATWFKEPSPGLRGLNAYVSDYQQISHYFGLHHGNILHNLDITDPVVECIDDLIVLDVRDSVSSIA